MQGQQPQQAHSDVRSSIVLRTRILILLFLAVFAVVATRLVQIQAIDSKKYQELARRQSEVKISLPAARGNIYDRSGTLIVSNTLMPSLAADPKALEDNADELASRLARVFDRPRRGYLDRLNSDRRFVWLERRVTRQQARAADIADVPGTMQLDEPRRLYHYEQLAGQMLGLTDIDNNGLSGVELECNGVLQGRDGYVILQRDALGRRRTSVDFPRFEPHNGRGVVLTIDVGMQSIAEDELRKGMAKSGAESGLVVMLDPSTGEVLAMAHAPGINPNDASHQQDGTGKIRAISDQFEPGSVFKIVTASAALEHRLVRPDQKFYAEHGRYVVQVGGGRQRVIEDTHPHDMLTLQQAIEQSSNIVMAKISNLIGAERLYTTARNFGFGNETGVDLPGEIRGELKRPSDWSGTTLNTLSYGYEVGVTPIQIASAYAAVANGGRLMKPFVVKKLLDDDGKTVSESKPQVIRSVISPETARMIRTYLEGVVVRGTGVQAKVEGVSIAGKTGTARKYVNGKYEEGTYTASFVGFFPVDDPKVVCLVMLDHPREGGYTGGLVSAPIFHGIAQKVYATSPRFMAKPGVIASGAPRIAPDVTMLTIEAARVMLAARGITFAVVGEGTLVAAQSPVAGTRLSEGQEVTLKTAEARQTTAPAGFAVVPNLQGLPIRRAMNKLTNERLGAEVGGSGIVAAQMPPAGTQVKVGSAVVLRCEPRRMPIISN
jgi:cell division protein FtsI (penicillin-binding protein 3)